MYESAKTVKIYFNTFNALHFRNFEISKFEIPISKLPRRTAIDQEKTATIMGARATNEVD
jgi:hypothetical protein